MTPDERRAVAWAVKIIDGFFALTGMEPKPENKARFAMLRDMARGGK